MAKAVDHYMVDYADDQGNALFANDVPLLTLDAAKASASKISTTHGSAFVIAFAKGDRLGTFTDIGSIPFFAGREDTAGTDGIIA